MVSGAAAPSDGGPFLTKNGYVKLMDGDGIADCGGVEQTKKRMTKAEREASEILTLPAIASYCCFATGKVFALLPLTAVDIVYTEVLGANIGVRSLLRAA